MLKFTIALLLFVFACRADAVWDNRVIESWRDLQSLSERLGDQSLNLTRVVLTGIQSAGKTSFVELLAGFPIGFTSASTGNRCPVEYTFILDESVSEVAVKFNSKPISQSQLFEEIGDHMGALARDNDFSEKPVKVEIRGPKVLPLVFIDMIGLIPEPSEETRNDQRRIERIFKRYARDPNNLLVVVVKGTEKAETILDIPYMHNLMISPERDISFHPPRTNWKREALFIQNYINRYSSDAAIFGSCQQTEAWIQEHLAGGERVFVVMNTDTSFQRDGATYAQIDQRIQTHQDAENKFFDEWLATVAKRSGLASCDSDLRRHLGIANAKTAIIKLFQRDLSAKIPGLVETAQRNHGKMQQRIETVEASLRKLNPELYKEALAQYSLEFSTFTTNFMNGDNHQSSKAKSITLRESRETFTYNISQAGQSLEQEFEQLDNVAKNNFKFFILSPAALLSEEHLGSNASSYSIEKGIEDDETHQEQLLGAQLRAALVGTESIKRLANVVRYCILNRANFFFEKRLAKQNLKEVERLLRDAILEMKNGYGIIHSGIRKQMDHAVQQAHQFLKGAEFRGYSSDNILAQVVNILSNEFRQQVEQQLQLVGTRFSESVEIAASHFDFDVVLQRPVIAISALIPPGTVPDKKVLESRSLPDSYHEDEDAAKKEEDSRYNLGPLNKTNVVQVQFEVRESPESKALRNFVLHFQQLQKRYVGKLPINNFFHTGLFSVPQRSERLSDQNFFRQLGKATYLHIASTLTNDLVDSISYYICRYFSTSNRYIENAIADVINNLNRETIANSLLLDIPSLETERKEAQDSANIWSQTIDKLIQLRRDLGIPI